MSDWKSRATPVSPAASAEDWKSRAKPLQDEGSPLDRALKEQSGDVVTVNTPTGDVRFDRQGRRVLDSSELKSSMDSGGALFRQRVLEGALSTLSGGGPWMDEIKGAEDAVSAFPAWLKAKFTGQQASDLGDSYRKGRDTVRREVLGATRNASPMLDLPIVGKIPALPLAGAMAPALLSPMPATALGRVGFAGYQGAESALASTDADVTNGGARRAADDTLNGLKWGLGGGVGGEALGAVANQIGRGAWDRLQGVKAAQAAKDSAEVASEIASLEGKLGGETQKASRMFENTQRALTGTPTPGSSPVSSEVQRKALEMLSDPATARLQEKILNRSIEGIPNQTGVITRLEEELAAKQAGAAAEAAKRTQEYFQQPVFSTEIAPRLKRLGENAALGAMAGGFTGGLTSMTMDGLVSGIGTSALSGGSGFKTMGMNAMRSNLVRAGALEGLTGAALATGNALRKSSSLVGPTAEAAKQNAYLELMKRFGIKAEGPDHLADEAFLRGQSE